MAYQQLESEGYLEGRVRSGHYVSPELPDAGIVAARAATGAPGAVPLQGLAHGQSVAYIGTFAKSLAPALRLGYLIVPEPLAGHVARAKWLTDRQTPTLTQAALALFITNGGFERHLRRARLTYRRRRDAFLSALARHLPEASHGAVSAGMHILVTLPGIILPALAEGYVVLADRYMYTSYVRDRLRGVHTALLDHIYRAVREPDLVLYLDVNPGTACERLRETIATRTQYVLGLDIGYAAEPGACFLEYQTRQHAAYEQLFEKRRERVVVIDANAEPDTVFQSLQEAVFMRLARA